MTVVPTPPANATAINEPVTVRLQGGEQATVDFETVQAVTRLQVPIVAISKRPQSRYAVKSDGTLRYGPAEIPPTDIDDLSVCFIPALEFEDTLSVEVSNLGGGAADYHVQPIGWEPPGGSA